MPSCFYNQQFRYRNADEESFARRNKHNYDREQQIPRALDADVLFRIWLKLVSTCNS